MPLIPDNAEDLAISPADRDRLFPWLKTDKLRGIPHLISPAWASDKSCFDPEGYADLWSRCKFDSVTLLTVHHDGFYLYPSELVRQKPERDFFGEQVEACRRRDIRTIAYYSLSLNSLVGSEHPEWRIRDTQDRVLVPDHRYFFHYHWLCVNGPFRDFAIAQLMEIARKYPVDGIFLDIIYLPPHPPAAGLQSGQDTCFCEHCHRSYSHWYGGEHLTDAIGTSRHDEFRAESYRRFLISLKRELKALPNPVAVGFNGAGRTRLPFYERVDALADWNASEAHHPHARGIYTRLRTADEKRLELMSCSELVWSHNVSKPTQLLELEAAATILAGGTYTLGVNHAPDGRLLPGNTSRLEPWARWCRELADEVEGFHPLQEASLMAPPVTDGYNGLSRWYDLLAQNHLQFRIVKNVAEMAGTKLWIFPDANAIDSVAWKTIQQHMDHGGAVLINGPLHTASKFCALAGITATAATERDCFYLQPATPGARQGILGSDPVIFHASAASIMTPEGWEVLAHLVEPFERKERLTDIQIAPNFPLREGVRDFHPGLSLRSHGRGLLAVAALDLAKPDKQHVRNPWPRILVGNLVRRLLGGQKMFEVEGYPGLEVLVMQKGSQVRLWLLNHYCDAGDFIGGEHELCRLADVKIALDLSLVNSAVGPTPRPAEAEVIELGNNRFTIVFQKVGLLTSISFAPTRTGGKRTPDRALAAAV